MSFLNRLFRRTKKAGSVGGEEQAVLIHLDGSSLPPEVYEQNDIATISDRILAALKGKGLGEYDGDEIGQGAQRSTCTDPMRSAFSQRSSPSLRVTRSAGMHGLLFGRAARVQHKGKSVYPQYEDSAGGAYVARPFWP